MAARKKKISSFKKAGILIAIFAVISIAASSALTVHKRYFTNLRNLKAELHEIGVEVAVNISEHMTIYSDSFDDPEQRQNFYIKTADNAHSIFKLTYAGILVPSEENGFECASDCYHSYFTDLYADPTPIPAQMFSENATTSWYDFINGSTQVCFTPLSVDGKTVCIVCTASDMGQLTADMIFIATMAALLAIVLFIICESITLCILSKRETERINAVISEIRTSTAEKVRVGADLNVATKIQADMLPTQFPATGNIELYAAMTPAKEVGGDFYDFFNIDRDHIALVMADVSGKGVPAALFMVIAKTLIQDRALMGRSPARVLEYANERLCQNNDSGLFVTAWVGVLELSTGNLTYSSAGHEYPVFRRVGGNYEMLTGDNAPPLAAMNDLEYEDTKTVLNSGDSLFLYTDGVPEAKSPTGKRFGNEKMLEILNEDPESSAEDVIKRLRTAIDEFDAGSDPFDDVTMMCLKYFGKA